MICLSQNGGKLKELILIISKISTHFLKDVGYFLFKTCIIQSYVPCLINDVRAINRHPVSDHLPNESIITGQHEIKQHLILQSTQDLAKLYKIDTNMFKENRQFICNVYMSSLVHYDKSITCRMILSHNWTLSFKINASII